MNAAQTCAPRCASCTTPSVCRSAGSCLDDTPSLVLAIGRTVAGEGAIVTQNSHLTRLESVQ